MRGKFSSASLLFLLKPTTFVTNTIAVKRLYSFLPIIALAFLAISCSGSKKMFKRGQELEENGMYEQAALSYMDALRRDDDNVEALVALQGVGQIVVDDKYYEFFQAVQNAEDQEAIRYYQEAEDFRAALRRYNIDIARPAGHEEDYQVVLDRYLEDLYQEGRNAIGNKDYQRAQGILEELIGLRSDYKDSQSLMRIAVGRPLYAEAMKAFDERNYRQAYRLFDNLEQRVDGEFDQSRHFKEIALRNGQFGLGIMRFENHTEFGGVEALLSSQITRILQEKNDPFLKLIDRTMLESLTAEQIRALSGQSDPNTAAEAGQLVGAKAILVGEFVSLEVNRGNQQRERRPGYLSRRVTRTNAEGERVSTTIYEKVWYYDVQQELRVTGIFQFKLVNVETGEIMLTNAISITERDQIDYSVFNGETSNLYMGRWESMNEDRPGDRVLRDSNSKRRLDERIEGRRQLRSDDELRSTLYNKIAEQAANEIYNEFLSTEG